MQASSSNIKEILKIKENFSNLSPKKIEKIHKSMNKLRKERPRINMIIKSPSRRQVIIPISTNNISKFMSLSSKHISNINRALKNIKSEIMANFVYIDNWELIITTNKVTSQSDLNTIKIYIKNIDVINSEDIMTLYLS